MAAIAAAAAAVSIGSTLFGLKKGRDAAKQTERAGKNARQVIAFKRRIAEIAAAREARQAIRLAARKTAEIQNQAVTSGAGDSSSVQGGRSAVRSQLGSNLGFNLQQREATKRIAIQEALKAKHLGLAGAASGQADIAFAISSFANKFADFGDLFGTDRKKES